MGHRPAKPIVAVISNLAALGTDTSEFRTLLHDWHVWSGDGSNYILVAETLRFNDSVDYLTSKGAVVPPSVKDHGSQVGPAFASHPSAKPHGVNPSDTTWQACSKIAKSSGWNSIDPNEF